MGQEKGSQEQKGEGVVNDALHKDPVGAKWNNPEKL